MVYRPFWQKIARTPMYLSYESSVDKGKKIGEIMTYDEKELT